MYNMKYINEEETSISENIKHRKIITDIWNEI